MVEGKSAYKDKAIEHYERFLALWKEINHGIAKVKDTKKRQDELKCL